MNANCCHDCHDNDPQRGSPVYRRVLWSVLAINAVMFAVEIGAGLAAGSASLQADALDFLGDAGNYAISLFVVGMALRYRAMAALAKGSTMAVFGLWIFGITGWHAWHETLPQAITMVGFAALAANAASFGLLWRHRAGDANMRSAWICTRNDVLGNLAVLLAALGVFGSGTGWPDVSVAAIMATLACKARSLLFGKLGSSYEPQGNQSQFSLGGECGSAGPDGQGAALAFEDSGAIRPTTCESRDLPPSIIHGDFRAGFRNLAFL